jgi:hypothetical protein
VPTCPKTQNPKGYVHDRVEVVKRWKKKNDLETGASLEGQMPDIFFTVDR